MTEEWVEIIEPKTKEHMFANLTTGECVWDPPTGASVKKTNDNQWWELFDINTSRFYYYNATSQKTVWNKPKGCDIIPLAKLQTLKQNTEHKQTVTQPKQKENKSVEARTGSPNLDLARTGSQAGQPASRTPGSQQASARKSVTKLVTDNDTQTSTQHNKSKRYQRSRCRAHSTTCSLSSNNSRSNHKSKSESTHHGHHSGQHGHDHHHSDRVSISSDKSSLSLNSNSRQGGKRNSAGQTSLDINSDRLSMIGDRLSVGGGSDRLSVGGTGHMAADRLSLHSAGGGSGMENGGKPLYNGVVKYANHRDSHYSKSGASNPPALGNSARYSANSGYVYQVPLSKQRSLEGDSWRQVLHSPAGSIKSPMGSQESSLSRSISFMARNDPRRNGEDGKHQDPDSGRRSIESTPNSARRYPVMSPDGSISGSSSSKHPHQPPSSGGGHHRHSRNSSISSLGSSQFYPGAASTLPAAPGILRKIWNAASMSQSGSGPAGNGSHSGVDGFPTPMINRRTVHSINPVDIRRQGGAPPNSSHLQPPSVGTAVTSESEDSIAAASPHRDRRRAAAEQLASGVQLRNHSDVKRSSQNLCMEAPTRPKQERSLTSLSLQVKKWKNKASKNKSRDSLDQSTLPSSIQSTPSKTGNGRQPLKADGKLAGGKSGESKSKISPLQQYMIEQAKLSGYRFGDKLMSGKRDSFIDSENESHKTGDDSDAFADDEAPSSDGGYEERDDISLVSTVSSVGEDDKYLTEPTYNNLDPIWAQRHGFPIGQPWVYGSQTSMYSSPGRVYGSQSSVYGAYINNYGSSQSINSSRPNIYASVGNVYAIPENPLDVDAFSEEFDLRMRYGRVPPPGSASSTMPRPAHSMGANTPTSSSIGSSTPGKRIGGNGGMGGSLRPGSVAQLPSTRDFVDGRNDLMSTSQISENNSGSTLSVSASIHSTLSASTLADLENFAASNLNIQKKGLFRKKVSLKDILSWQAEGISKPLTPIVEKQLKKEAVNVFKLVQIYMTDRKAKMDMTINSVPLDIAEKGVMHPGLRDEIYIQLCKQTSENPRKESLRRGWELMAMCLQFFPPSAGFQPYLLGYIQRHFEAGGGVSSFGGNGMNHDSLEGMRWSIHAQISHYASICGKRLGRIGVGGKLNPKKPTEEDIDQSRLQIFRQSMFGGTLEEVLDIQKDKFPTRRLPWILTTLTQQILGLNGLTTEGIFRIPADFDEVSSSKCRYDQWEVTNCSDAHVPAALLKLWLRELYIPLIPDDELYSAAIQSGDDAKAALSVVDRLPELHNVVLRYLISFLQLFARADVVAVTKMDASNLSMVFAPNFLRCPSSDPVVIMENTRKEMAFVKILIHNLDTENMRGVL